MPEDGGSLVRRPIGAPSLPYDEGLAEEYVMRMLAGETVDEISASPHMPSWPTICKWRLENGVFAGRYARAREASAESCEHNAIRAARLAVDNETASAMRVQVDIWKWAAAKRNPRTHGDRTTVAGDPDNPLVVQHRLTARRDLLRRLDALADPEPLTIDAAPEPGE